jgi:hypothetical protein
MKCNICGREYIALGVHLRHKHKIDPDDYREEFGILRTTPLIDEDLSAHLSAGMKRRLQDDDYKAAVQARCRDNADANKGKPPPSMTRAGKAALAKLNTEANAEYLNQQAPKVAKVLREKGTMLDVRKATGTGPTAGRKMAKIAGVAYTGEAAKIERDKRAAATIRAKALARVAKVMPYFDTTKSAAEMCRLGGISIKTYKNWLAAGLIARHPNGRGPMPHKHKIDGSASGG